MTLKRLVGIKKEVSRNQIYDVVHAAAVSRKVVGVCQFNEVTERSGVALWNESLAAPFTSRHMAILGLQ